MIHKKLENILSKLFEISILAKFVEGIFEIIGGILLIYSIKRDVLTSFVLKITEHELEQDPNSFIAKRLVEAVQNINPHISFGMVYLLAHGIIKTFLSVMLLKRKIWAYPLAIYIWFTLAILLLIKFFTTWSVIYLVLSFFDFGVGFLTIHDYKKFKIKICYADQPSKDEA